MFGSSWSRVESSRLNLHSIGMDAQRLRKRQRNGLTNEYIRNDIRFITLADFSLEPVLHLLPCILILDYMWDEF